MVETDENVFIIMEYAAGGDLSGQFSKDNESGNLVEHHVKIQFYQIAHAVAFLHSKNVCHRDLKLENILQISSRFGPTRASVPDEGLSARREQVGDSPTYSPHGLPHDSPHTEADLRSIEQSSVRQIQFFEI